MADKVTLTIDGMSCEHCVMTVQKALSGLDNVKNAKVNLKKKEAQVKFEGGLGAADLIKAVEDAGYKAAVK